MQIHEIKISKRYRKKRIVVGRGRGSGHGKNSGRGQGRNQNARTGRGILRSLEGGQIPLIRRIPKVGFRSHRPVVYQVVNLRDLSNFKAGSTIDAHLLKEQGLISNIFKPFKILGDGEIKNALTVQAYSFSKSAVDKITHAGGKAETVNGKIIKERISAAK